MFPDHQPHSGIVLELVCMVIFLSDLLEQGFVAGRLLAAGLDPKILGVVIAVGLFSLIGLFFIIMIKRRHEQ